MGAATPFPQTPEQRRVALIAGVWFAITFLASIPALFLYEPLLKHHDYILGGGADTRVGLGATLEIILVIAQHRHRGRALSDSSASEPEHQPRLRREPHHRVGDHRRRRHQRPVGR